MLDIICLILIFIVILIPWVCFWNNVSYRRYREAVIPIIIFFVLLFFGGKISVLILLFFFVISVIIITYFCEEGSAVELLALIGWLILFIIANDLICLI